MIKKKLKAIISTSLVVVVSPFFFSLSFLVNDGTNSNIQKNKRLEQKLVEISDSNVVGDSINKQFSKTIGIKRFDIIFNGNNQIDLKSKLNTIANKYLKTKQEDLVFILGKYLKTISIAITNEQNYDSFKNALAQFANNDNDVASIYGFKSLYTYEDFVQKKKNNIQVQATNNKKINKRYNQELAFDLRSDYSNDYLYSLVGLNKSVKTQHFKDYIDAPLLKVGILESGGVANDSATPFQWNNKYGNGVHWRNELFYYESWSNHANNVAEIIVGQKGINPTLKLWSVQLDTFWNGMTGEMDFFLYSGVKIINNSWSFVDPKRNKWLQTYNSYSKYVDELIQSNPEIINFFSAGNVYDGNDKELPYKDIAGVALSKNSIIVGAIDTNENQNKTSYSQIGNDINYVTAVAYGGNYNFSSWNEREDGYYDSGTSFSTPVITALSSMIVQRNKYYFDKGHDSIIMKSALISGSKKPNYTNEIYTKETGFGIPQFFSVDQAVKNLEYIKKANIGYSRKIQLHMNKGENIRANISWLTHIFNNKNIVDFDIKVYDPNNQLVASSTKLERNTETVEFEANETGNYVFEIYRYDKNDIERDVAFTYVKI